MLNERVGGSVLQNPDRILDLMDIDKSGEVDVNEFFEVLLFVFMYACVCVCAHCCECVA